jgi:hypothetical protein
VGRYFAHGWIDQFFIAPRVFFPYPGLEWIVPLPGAGMYALFAGLGLLALCIVCGLWYRASVALFCLGFTYAHLIDRTNYLNHYYLVSLLSALMVFLPLHRAGSLDAWRRPALRRATVPALAVWLLRFQLGIVYAFGAVAKLNADWLLDAQPLRIWLGANVDVPLIGAWLEQPWVAYAGSYLGLLFDLAVVPLLLYRRTRAWAYAAVLGFHLVTALLFPIGMFPWLMTALTPIFFAPDWPRRWISRRRVAVAAPDPAIAASHWSAGRIAGVAAAGVYVCLQIAVPLRHFAHPGSVYWHEQGFRFAWQIMVMEKYGRAAFHVTDPHGGATTDVAPAAYLTALQMRMMATQPDMIRSFARHLAADFAARGQAGVEVRANVFVSLNGRPHRRFIDPDIDLAALRDDASLEAIVCPDPSSSRTGRAKADVSPANAGSVPLRFSGSRAGYDAHLRCSG